MRTEPDQDHCAAVAPYLWRLDARPDLLAGSAATWRELGRVADAATRSMGVAAGELLERWQEESAEVYRRHVDEMAGALAAVAGVASRIAVTIDDVAGVLRTAQDHLDSSWARLRRTVPITFDGEALLTSGGERLPRPVDATDTAGAARVTAAAAEATEIRADADGRLAALAGVLDGLRRQLWPHAARAEAKEDESAAWVREPELAGAGRVIMDGNRVIVNGSGGADRITVSADARTGEQLVVIGGVVHRLPAGAEVVVRAGDGGDTVTVAPGSRVRLTLLAGAGDDRVRAGDGGEALFGLWGRDTIEAGDGADRVSGGAGADYVDGQGGDDLLDGGSGEDTLYGLDGTDLLRGGADRDYLDGGASADSLDGGADDDVVMGGSGVDALRGRAGDDALYGGDGADVALGGPGHDRAFTQPGDAVGGAERTVTVEPPDVAGFGEPASRTASGFLRIEGSPEFVARVQSDVDALRASERGAMMLDALRRAHDESRSPAADWPILGGLVNQGHTLTIRETDAANGYADRDRDLSGQVDATIDYNPRFDDLWRNPPVPPVVVLYHELAHVYDFVHGTLADGSANFERVAVGLPIDHDGDPATPERIDPRHPYEYTENGLRDEFGRPPRTQY